MKPSTFLGMALPFFCRAASALSNNNIESFTVTDFAGQRVDFGKNQRQRQPDDGLVTPKWRRKKIPRRVADPLGGQHTTNPIPSPVRFQTIRSSYGGY